MQRWLPIALIAVAASGHSYHSSIAQLDYIASKKMAEATIFLHTEDVERTFHTKLGPHANFDNPALAEKFVAEYLQSHFLLRGKRRELLRQQWIGMEVKVHFLTVYLEVPLVHGWSGVTLENGIFLDVPGQTNSVQVKLDGRPLRELQFTAADGHAPQSLP